VASPYTWILPHPPLPVGFGVLAFFDDFLTIGWYDRLNLTAVVVSKTALRQVYLPERAIRSIP
jgi:hypothetical protein